MSYHSQLKLFLEQAETDKLKTKHFNSKYNGLEVKVSFGQGTRAKIPWISFLKAPNTTSNGIYPVYLYYRDFNILILAYGISETNIPEKRWKITNQKTISEYFVAKDLGKPHRYGSSFVHKVYQVNNMPSDEVLDKDLNDIIAIYKKHLHSESINIGFLHDIESEKDNSPSPEEPHNSSESPNFWWLNANPQIWSIDSFKVGDIQTYTSHNENGNKRRIYKYFEEVKPSDLVIGYESHPTKQVKAIYKITEGLHVDDNEGEIISFEIKEKIKDPISWDKLKETKGLEECEVLNNNQGSLFKLTAEQFNIIKNLSDGESTTNAKKTKEVQVKPYSFSDDPDKPFLEEHEIKGIIESLEVKKNMVLQGPPGVGKIFIAKKIAYEMMKKIDDSKIKMVQFHQSYSYEDFIQGIRPSRDGFTIKNGVFYDFCKKAASEPNQKYFFIIDEINRGNLSKIFGELMMLIESDKRGKHSLPLTYSEKDDPEFSVPENLYIIGNMNTADRSLAIVDYALRRRFRFITLEPKFNERFKDFLSSKGFKKDFIEKITFKINSLNEKIEEDKNLGRGFLIGHSFFCGAKRGTEREWFENIVKFEIEPLLEEYWFDDNEKVKKEINLLLS